MTRGGLARARHDAGRDRGGAAQPARSSATTTSDAFVPARVLNLVVIVDGEFRGEIENRLERVGPLPPVAARAAARSSPGRKTIDAWASVGTEDATEPGEISLGRERVELDIGERHLQALDTIVDPLLVPDLATLVWAPHGHAEAVDALRRLAQIVLVDSQDEPDVAAALDARRRAARATPTSSTSRGCARRRGASASPPRSTRRALRPRAGGDLGGHRPPPRRTRWPPALLFCGWLCSRLGWQPGLALAGGGGRWSGHARARRAGGQAARSSRSSSPSAPGPGGRDDRDGLGRARCRSTARPAGCASVRRARDGTEQVVDRAGRLARRGRHPRRGRPPGAAARPHLPVRRSASRGRWCVDRLRPDERDRVVEDPGGRGGGALLDAAERGGHIVLTGGSTPQRALRARRRGRTPTGASATVWFTDERCVPPDHPDSNFAMADDALLGRLRRPAARASMRMRGRARAPRRRPAPTRRCVREQLGDDPRCDLLLLGLGPGRAHGLAVPRQAGGRGAPAARRRRADRGHGAAGAAHHADAARHQQRARRRLPRHRRRQGARRSRARSATRPTPPRPPRTCARAPARSSSYSTRPRRAELRVRRPVHRHRRRRDQDRHRDARGRQARRLASWSRPTARTPDALVDQLVDAIERRAHGRHASRSGSACRRSSSSRPAGSAHSVNIPLAGPAAARAADRARRHAGLRRERRVVRGAGRGVRRGRQAHVPAPRDVHGRHRRRAAAWCSTGGCTAARRAPRPRSATR